MASRAESMSVSCASPQQLRMELGGHRRDHPIPYVSPTARLILPFAFV